MESDNFQGTSLFPKLGLYHSAGGKSCWSGDSKICLPAAVWSLRRILNRLWCRCRLRRAGGRIPKVKSW